jgi:hypothetical protein
MTRKSRKKIKTPFVAMRPSEALRVALEDLRLVESDPHYKVDMTTWHSPSLFGDKCEVCLAGSVMAKTCGARIGAEISPDSYKKETEKRLRMLDDLRKGLVRDGLANLDIPLPREMKAFVGVGNYPEKRWWRAMKSLATKLERQGL